MTVSLKFKSFIALLMSAVLLFLPNSPAFAASIPDPQLNIKTVYQAKTMWCWAATSVMLLNYYGNPIRQEEYVKEVFEGETSNSTIPEFQFESELEDRGIYGDSKNRAATWNEITQSIDNGDPIVAYIDRSRRGKVAHMLIIEGYFTQNNIDYVHVNDPSSTGGKYELTYEELLDDGNNVWYGTLLNINKNRR